MAKAIFKRLQAIKKAGRGLVPGMDIETANEKEAGLRVRDNDARMKAKLRAAASGKVFVPPRADPLADRDIFLEIQASIKAGASVRLVSRQGPGVIRRKVPIHSTEWNKIRAEDRKAKRQQVDLNAWVKQMWVPHWDHTGDMLKGMALGYAVFEADGHAFTLRLSPSVIQAGRADPLGFAQHMRRRISREMKKVAQAQGIDRPEFFFTVEDTDLTEVHLHGAIIVSKEDSVLKAVRVGLKAAGGKWKAKDSGRQLDMPALETPLRWMSYIFKWRLGSALHLGGKSFAATNGVRGLARGWYKRARQDGLVLRADKSWSDFGIITF